MRISGESQGSSLVLTHLPTLSLLSRTSFLWRVFARPLLILDADASRETSREIPSIILTHAFALWPHYESSRGRGELFDLANGAFLTALSYPPVYYPRPHVRSQPRVISRNISSGTAYRLGVYAKSINGT